MSDKPPSTVKAVVDLQVAEDAPPEHPDFDEFQCWADLVAQHKKQSIELTIRLVTEAESETLNHQYRGKQAPTNVLSFPFEVPPGIEWDEPLIGDLVVCGDVINREATEQQKPNLHHWAHICVHGILHLLGYDHINESDASVMEALECQLLAQLDIPDPYVPQEIKTTHE